MSNPWYNKHLLEVFTIKEIYGIGLKRTNKVPYCIPMSLEEIDYLTSSHSLEEILEILKQNDSVITETDPHSLRIFRYLDRWKEWNLDFIKKDETYILTFSFASLFESVSSTKILNILYNHFSLFLKKDYIRPEFKKVISSMKEGEKSFLSCISLLS